MYKLKTFATKRQIITASFSAMRRFPDMVFEISFRFGRESSCLGINILGFAAYLFINRRQM